MVPISGHVAASEVVADVLSAVAARSVGFTRFQAFGLFPDAPLSAAPAQTGTAAAFLTQLMSQHVAPFLVSFISEPASAGVVSVVRERPSSKNLSVIKAYADGHIVAELSKLLSSPESTVREYSLGCLVIVAALSSSSRGVVNAQVALALLAGLIAACSVDANDGGLLRISDTLLSSMVAMKHVVDIVALQPSSLEICRLFGHAYLKVQVKACEALAAVTVGLVSTYAPAVCQNLILAPSHHH